MKKSLLVLPALLLLLAACAPGDNSSSINPGPSDSTGGNVGGGDAGGTSLLAKYDLGDQVRTPYGDGVNTKFTTGQFATLLESKMVAGGTDKLASSSGETNVYLAEQSASETGPQFNGIKFGGSQKSGTVTLNFDAGTGITKVVVGCAGWIDPTLLDKTPDTLTVGGVTNTPTQGGVTATVAATTFEFAATDTLTITSNYRIIVNYIEIYVG
jgi:hypothetical protein